MFEFLSRIKILQSRKVEPSTSLSERIDKAKSCLKEFMEKSFDKKKTLYELDNCHPRFVIKENAERLIEKMLEKASRIEEIKIEERNVGDVDHTTSDEFNVLNRDINAIYQEIRNIGETADTGHRLYRISDTYPYVDDSLGGIMDRFFALPYRELNERKPEESYEVSEINKDEEELVSQDFSYLSTLRNWFRMDARVDPVDAILDEEDTQVVRGQDMSVIDKWEDSLSDTPQGIVVGIDEFLLQTPPIIGDIAPIIDCG